MKRICGNIKCNNNLDNKRDDAQYCSKKCKDASRKRREYSKIKSQKQKGAEKI